MSRKLQNEDVKTEADITGAGGTASQLINDTKIYVTANSLNKRLDAAIIAGDLGGMANPMTTGGDVIYGGASGTPARLANGSNGQLLTSSGGTAAPTWTTVSGFTAPTAMTDVQATSYGLKQYLSGTNYNSGISPTTTAPSCTVARARFIPYQMQDGAWRMRFNITMTRASGANIADLTVTIIGIVFKNISNDNQALSMSADNLTSDANIGHSAAVNNTNTLFGAFSANNILTFRVSGDVELNAKPTWAY